MPKQTVPLYALNRGEVSRLALARVDVDKLRLAAEVQVNWMPLTLGPTTLRPGSQYIGGVHNDAPAQFIEFVYSATDCALVEFTDLLMRVWVDDAPISRPAVGASIQPFPLWTVTASPGATVSTIGPLTIYGVTYGQSSSAEGHITIVAGEENIEHAVRIEVSRGPVLFRIGTTSGGSEILATTSLETGTHSIAFTPGATTVYCDFSSNKLASCIVDSIAVEGPGILTIPTPWPESSLRDIRYDQSADVVFIACKGHAPRKLERRSRTSWSIVTHRVWDGPFPGAPGDESFTFTPSGFEGDIILTANKSFFRSGHVGALMRLFHNGQTRQANLNRGDTYTRPIRVSGTTTSATFSGTDRQWGFNLSGTWSGTIVVERTYDPDGVSDWVVWRSYTTNGFRVLDDGLTNVIVWYRIGFQSNAYTSGTAEIGVTYDGGGGSGIGEIFEVSSPTSATLRVVEYVDSVGRTVGYISDDGPSASWRMSEWNEVSGGFPSSVTIHEGRMVWSGANRIWASVSDNYYSHDFDKTGDAAPIARTIGKGPVATTNFLLSLSRLALGTDHGVVTARSSSFDEPLTPTAFNLKYSTNQGAARLRAVQVDASGVFVQRSSRRVYMLTFQAQASDFIPFDLTRLNLDIGLEGFVDISVQRQPDTRILLVRGDGQLAVLLFDQQDDVQAWWRVQTDGVIENVMVLPGTLEDQVYVVVRRTINGATKRYLERFARLDECTGGMISKLADCHIVYSGASTATIPGLSHLEGKDVVVWGDGREIGFDENNSSVVARSRVTGGAVILPEPVSQAVIGLPYEADLVTAKLAYAAAQGTALNQPKRVGHMGFVLNTTHYQGIRFGHWHDDPTQQILSSLPRVEAGATTPKDTIWQAYDQQMIPIPGRWDTDARLMVKGQAPRPATIQSIALEIETSG